MANNTEAIRLLVEDMSASEEAAFLKWLRKRAPRDTTLSGAVQWWLAKLRSGNVLPDGGWPSTLAIDDLTDDYIKTLRRDDISKVGNASAMGKFLRQVCPKIKDQSLKGSTPKKRVRTYTIPGLDECRAEFEKVYGKQEWPGAQAEAPEGDSEAPEGD